MESHLCLRDPGTGFRCRGLPGAWPHQKVTVENLAGWVKGSFFKQRRFHDIEDLKEQLPQRLQEVSPQWPSGGTPDPPADRMEQERCPPAPH